MKSAKRTVWQVDFVMITDCLGILGSLGGLGGLGGLSGVYFEHGLKFLKADFGVKLYKHSFDYF